MIRPALVRRARLVPLALAGVVDLGLTVLLAAMLLDGGVAAFPRAVAGLGLAAVVALATGAFRLVKSNEPDDRFHAGLLLGIAGVVALAATGVGFLSEMV